MASGKLDAASAELIELRAWRKEATATLAHLAARNISLYSALERTVQVLAMCDGVGEPHPTHDAVIAGLAKVCGSGEMMKACVHEWRGHLRLIHNQDSPSWNHFTVGPTRDALEGALRVGRAALEHKP